MTVKLMIGDCRERLRELPDESMHCAVTSPPYFGLRDYGTAGQIGLEATPEAYVSELVQIFREVRRVLRRDGTVWLILGDSYAANGARGNNNGNGSSTMGWPGQDPATLNKAAGLKLPAMAHGLKPKDLIGIPWRVAFAFQADGWWLRQDIIWAKPNPMPESVTDRCTKAHEYIFLLTKAARYFYDAIAIADTADTAGQTRVTVNHGGGGYQSVAAGVKPSGNQVPGTVVTRAETRNKRSVWEIATQPFSEAHFATFPPALIEPCIKAGCPEKCCAKCGAPWVRETTHESGTTETATRPKKTAGMDSATSTLSMSGGSRGWQDRGGKRQTLGFSPSCNCNADTVPGTVLDPFGGAGTTGLVADRLGRNAVLIELNPAYADLAKDRVIDDAPLFADVAAE